MALSCAHTPPLLHTILGAAPAFFMQMVKNNGAKKETYFVSDLILADQEARVRRAKFQFTPDEGFAYMQILKQLLLVRPSDRRGLVTFLTLEAWGRWLIKGWWHREGTSNKSAQPGTGTVPAAKEPGHKGTLEGTEIPGQYTKQWMHPPHRGLGGAPHTLFR